MFRRAERSWPPARAARRLALADQPETIEAHTRFHWWPDAACERISERRYEDAICGGGAPAICREDPDAPAACYTDLVVAVPAA